MVESQSGTATPHPRGKAEIVSVEPLVGVRAGSALVRHRERLLLAQDDDYTLFWVDLDATPVGTESVPLRHNNGAMPKSLKPDFEAAARLSDGRILVMGSGSAEPRRTVVLVDPHSNTFTTHDAGRLYDLVSEAVGHEINLEGVLEVSEGLLLFHRGNSGDGNATISFAVNPENPAAARVREVMRWDLGTVPGENGQVALTFTDADVDVHGRHWYIAAAEDTPNAIDDGPVVGSAIGIIVDDQAHWAPITEPDGSVSCRKYEGLVIDDDLSGAWLVTDPDDENLHAELCRVRLTGWHG